MKILLNSAILGLCLLNIQTSGQSNYSDISRKFMQFYNAQAPDSIFFLYTPELQEKLPLEKTQAVISGLHIQYGDLMSLVLLKQDSGFNVYKASFTHQTLGFLFSLSADDLIDGYRLVPYNPDQYPEEKKKKQSDKPF